MPGRSTHYASLTEEEAEHFLQHGWLKVPNAIDPRYVDAWVADVWARTGYKETDKTTWEYEYLHMPFHRQVRWEYFAPGAFKKIADICGGEERIDPVRERSIGDNFVINFGTEARSQSARATGEEKPPQEKRGWHCDNDWFRQFLDSSGTALTVINCFTDIPDRGGVQAKKGDVFILHGLLPHSTSWNYLHYPRIITNVHITLREPLDLHRSDGNYSLVEQTILRGLGRDSIPEFKPTRDRMYWYPRNSPMKGKRIEGELRRMVEAAKAKGLDESAVDSIWLKGKEVQDEFDHVNGMLLPVNTVSGLETEQHPI
ncbi:hypothetical protein BJX65DRAFT_307262 [Aspergillus insuetus]